MAEKAEKVKKAEKKEPIKKTAKQLINDAKKAGFWWAEALENAYFTQNPGSVAVRFTSVYALITTAISYQRTEEGSEFWLIVIRDVLNRNFGRSFDYLERPSDFHSENARRAFEKAMKKDLNEKVKKQ